MEGRNTDNLKSIVILYIVMFIGLGVKCHFKFGLVYGVLVVLSYLVMTFVGMNTYRMTVNHEFIKVYRWIGKNECICIKDVYKIELQNFAWQLFQKDYRLVVYTPGKVYELSTDLFKTKDLKQYLEELCRKENIEYGVID